MAERRYYCVAGHAFSVETDKEMLGLMENYAPFWMSESQDCPLEEQDLAFALSAGQGEATVFDEELRQEDEGQQIICGHTSEGQRVFEFRSFGKTAGWLVSTPDYRQARLDMTGYAPKLAIDNALMILFALSTARSNTVLMHAATVSHKNRAYLFLGKSGTGKSTHARLWLNHIEGTALVNDDNPVVRIGDDGIARVYGSPWSGKTPCYRNVDYPLGGFVNLSQAPYNKIRPLRGLEAYAALLPSISGMRWDRQIADGLHQTEEAMVRLVPAWHLECLPDEAAAQLCAQTIAK